MNINKYVGYFHDGTLINIEQYGKNIEIVMISAELEPEWDECDIPLAKNNRIKGKIHIKNVKSIIINDKHYENLKMFYDEGEISGLDIFNEHKMKLVIRWNNLYSKYQIQDFQIIDIEAEKIYWENLPELQTFEDEDYN